MTLYKYELSYRNQVTCEEMNDFEEKAKTYTRKQGYPRRILKEDIGVVRREYSTEVILLTNDIATAKEKFKDHYENKLQHLIERYENESKELKDKIDFLK